MIAGSASIALDTSDSLGMNAITSSGDASSPAQYVLLPSAVMWSRTP